MAVGKNPYIEEPQFTPATKKYKVVGWAPVSEEARAAGGEPVWDVVARYLRAQKTIAPRVLNLPKVEGVAGNPGLGA